MSRTSWSPLKDAVKLPHPPIASLGIVTHYTDHPYHKDRMEVVSLCLRSMLGGGDALTREVLVWDNGSTDEFRQMLRSFKPNILVESENVGAHNARRNLAEMARGDILCLTDDDILFHPDWYHRQLEVLTTYPNVGIVSGSPYRWAFRWGQTFIPQGATVRRGKLIPEQWIKDACISVGQNYAVTKLQLMDVEDVELEYDKVRAWAHGHHMQFMGWRKVVTPFLKRSEFYLGNGRQFNTDILNAGLLQLTTHSRTAVHIGNHIDESIKSIMAEWKME